MNHVTLDHSGTKNILGPSQPAGPFQWVFMGQIKTVRRSLSDSTYANIIGCMTSSVVNSKISKKVINEQNLVQRVRQVSSLKKSKIDKNAKSSNICQYKIGDDIRCFIKHVTKPERFSPGGMMNLAFNSHNLWHAILLLSFIHWRKCLLIMIGYRLEHVCYT